jgi:serine/threonine protein kinase
MELSIGQTVGDYEILGVLGAGGMGKVYQVRNRISGRVEAMKILLPDLNSAHDLVDRFLREIRISGSLDHPNIAAMRTAQQIDNQLIMIMEFVEGSTLDALMKQGKIPAAKGIDYMKQALAALKYAHSQGVVHRDIKPGNMMLTPSGVLKLMDFGIAKMATDPKLTKTGLMVGSVYYMSPEQIEGKDLDGRSDLYSLGITLYEIATGKRPFDGDSEYKIMAAHLKENPPPPRELDPSLPSDLNDIIMLAMEKDPAQRFQTAEAFQNALSAIGAQPPAVPQPKPQSLPPITPSPVVAAQRNNRLWYMLAGSAATIAVIVAGVIEIPKYMHTGAASKPEAAQSVQAPAAVPQQSAAPQVTPTTAPEPTPVPPAAVSAPVPDTHAAQPVKTPAKPAATAQQLPAQQVAAQPPQVVAQPEPPQPQPQSQPTKPAPPANTAELAELRERANLMSVRVATIRTAFQNLQKQQAASGLSPRSDMVAADQRLDYQLQQAEASLGQGDSANARKRLDAAERDLEKLESFLGK